MKDNYFQRKSTKTIIFQRKSTKTLMQADYWEFNASSLGKTFVFLTIYKRKRPGFVTWLLQYMMIREVWWYWLVPRNGLAMGIIKIQKST